jgi:hypothetical protein
VIRTLPKNVPPAVIAAAQSVLRKADDAIIRRQQANAAYVYVSRRPWSNQRIIPGMKMALDAKAQMIIDWGAMLQEQLPVKDLNRRFRTPGGSSECFPVVRQEIVLEKEGDFPGGRLVTELALLFDADYGLFRHYERIDGFLVNGGGVLNSVHGIRSALQPETLDGMHGQVAEGENWRFIETELEGMLEAHKDR